jgi:hypothetical protein
VISENNLKAIVMSNVHFKIHSEGKAKPLSLPENVLDGMQWYTETQDMTLVASDIPDDVIDILKKIAIRKFNKGNKDDTN